MDRSQAYPTEVDCTTFQETLEFLDRKHSFPAESLFIGLLDQGAGIVGWHFHWPDDAEPIPFPELVKHPSERRVFLIHRRCAYGLEPMPPVVLDIHIIDAVKVTAFQETTDQEKIMTIIPGALDLGSMQLERRGVRIPRSRGPSFPSGAWMSILIHALEFVFKNSEIQNAQR
jgi:hypothetical protein